MTVRLSRKTDTHYILTNTEHTETSQVQKKVLKCHVFIARCPIALVFNIVQQLNGGWNK